MHLSAPTLLSQIGWVAVFFVALVHWPSASAETPLLQFEPTFKATVALTTPLPVGTKLTFTASDFKPNEVFMLQRCGEPCNTAKMIRVIRKVDWQRSNVQSVEINEAGSYYFWIMRTLENGEVGPVIGESITIDGSSGVVHFASGSTLSVAVDFPKGAVISNSLRQEMEARSRESLLRDRPYEMVAVHAFWDDASFMTECVSRGSFTPTSFVIYFEVLPDGGLGSTLFEPLTETAKCVKQHTSHRTFPKPSGGAYVTKIEMSFQK